MQYTGSRPIVCCELEPRGSGLKVSEDGESCNTGVMSTPIPVSGRFCGLPAALSETSSRARRVPTAAGVNWIVTSHCDPGARLLGDCGQEFCYDWAEMRIGEPVSPRAYTSGAESFSTAHH